MKREEFGKICASLRQEMFNPVLGRVWSQEDLARETNMPLRLVGQIERGERMKFDEDILSSLAHIFRLTTTERERFLSFANHVPHDNIARDEQNIHLALNHILDEVKLVRQPLIIHDGLYRIVGINSAYKAIYGLTDDYLNQIPEDDPTKYHIVRHIHDTASPVRKVYLNQIAKTELNNAIYWRYLSIGHRHDARYKTIQTKLLSTFPRFQYLYSSLNYELASQDSSGLLRSFSCNHPNYGLLKYLILSTRLYGGGRELFMPVLIPSNERTLSIFNQLINEQDFSLICFESVVNDLN